MDMNTRNENVSTGMHFVNQSVLVGDRSTPTSLVLMFQSFRFTDTLKRVLSNVSDQFKNLFHQTGLTFRPLGEVFYGNGIKNNAVHSLVRCCANCSKVSPVKVMILSLLRFSSDWSSLEKYSSRVSRRRIPTGDFSVMLIVISVFSEPLTRALILFINSSVNSDDRKRTYFPQSN